LKGTVIRSTGSWYTVRTDDGTIVDCKIKGRFRIKDLDLKPTNPLAVGDHVEFNEVAQDESPVIHAIADRKNYIIRKATKLSKQVHIIAANLDQAILITTIKHPNVKVGFINRFLVTAEAYSIPGIVVFNKVDLYDQAAMDTLQELLETYESVGYKCLVTSVETGENLDEFKALLKDKVSLLSGHSGVGKSSIINKVEPGLDLKTADISEFNEKGRHTTTFAEMFPLSEGGSIIDTPGIKSFGLFDFKQSDLGHYFPEMRDVMNNCGFNDCTHVNEPRCAVKQAVENGTISYSRYESYLNLYYEEEL